MSWQLEELELAASLVQKEEPQNNDQGSSQELSDPHEFEETDDSTETDDDDEDEGEDEDDDEDEAGDEDENGDDDEAVDNGRGHDENVEGIITKTDSSKDSTERNSLLGNDNDKETNL